jgi:hypothetical protein
MFVFYKDVRTYPVRTSFDNKEQTKQLDVCASEAANTTLDLDEEQQLSLKVSFQKRNRVDMHAVQTENLADWIQEAELGVRPRE